MEALRGGGRAKKLAAIGALASIVLVGYWARGKLGGGTASWFKQQTASLYAVARRDGVKLIVDGRDVGTAPQRVTGLAPGEHTIVFEGGDRYAALKRNVTLSPNETKRIEASSLKVTRGSAAFDVKTPGASLALIASDERRPIQDYSQPVDVDNSKSWSLEASKAGFKTLTMPVIFDDQAEKTFVVVLTEPSKEADNPPVAEQDEPAEAPRVGKKRGRSAKATSAAATKPSTVAAEAPAKDQPVAATPPAEGAQAGGEGNCTLNINSIPIARVVLDGHPMGLTPKMGVSVAAGKHRLLLVTDSARKRTRATCKAGEKKTIAVRIGS